MRHSISIAIVAALCAVATYAFAQKARDQEPDVPKTPGVCALYFTHQHAAGKSWQLTCSDPVPPLVILSLKDSARAR